MSSPALTTYQNGFNQVSGDQLNTFQQTCDTVADLRNFIGLPGVQVYVRGISSNNDGGQGSFIWNASGGGTDNGMTNIVPSSASSGAWNRLDFDALSVWPYFYSVPVTGFSITIPNNVNFYIINPAGTLATGTFTMSSLPYDGQIQGVSSSQTVTTLTINGNTNQNIISSPSLTTSITAGASLKFIYRAANLTWYRA